MTVAEVEATVGPINQQLKNSANHAATPEMQRVDQALGFELHLTYTDSAYIQKVQSGGNPRNSSYVLAPRRECATVADYELHHEGIWAGTGTHQRRRACARPTMIRSGPRVQNMAVPSAPCR
jgi:hypothetical protein